MVTGDGGHSAAILLLERSLEKLRVHEGLTQARVGAGRNESRALLDLPATRRLATTRGLTAADAALEIVRHCVARELRGTYQIVADAVFAVGLLRARYLEAGVNERVVHRLYSDNLGTRRDALLGSWAALHAAVAAPPIPSPSDRTLRGQIESDVVAALARAIGRFTPDDLPRNGGEVAAPDSAGRAMVIGGAVMDVAFRVKALPQLDTSQEASDCRLLPGGKGLTQAVALARLGLRTTLVAAVGDDDFGHEILAFLSAEGVDTSYVKVVPDARTPITGVINLELGHNMAINWRNDSKVLLDRRDLDRMRDELARQHVLLMSLEPPAELISYVLADLLGTLETRPITVVTAGPPYSDHVLGGRVLNEIDYLVAYPWELRPFAAGDQDPADLEATAKRLLRLGLGGLCVPIDGGCSVYVHTHTDGSFQVPSFPTLYKDTAGARDAFCAALADQLWAQERAELSEDVALWATAAMAAATADHGVPQSMPRRRHIESILKRSRFEVRPRRDEPGPTHGARG